MSAIQFSYIYSMVYNPIKASPCTFLSFSLSLSVYLSLSLSILLFYFNVSLYRQFIYIFLYCFYISFLFVVPQLPVLPLLTSLSSLLFCIFLHRLSIQLSLLPLQFVSFFSLKLFLSSPFTLIPLFLSFRPNLGLTIFDYNSQTGGELWKSFLKVSLSLTLSPRKHHLHFLSLSHSLSHFIVP